MFLIADSGSTKTDWCVADKSGTVVKQIQTEGINPFLQTESEISSVIAHKLYPAIEDFTIENIYFYGAGCAFEDKNEMIRRSLATCIQSQIEVYSDLMAAARALCGSRPGIACIMGTGSNSCQYDGANIVKHVSPLGFILGDEGSGATLGRILVGDVLKNQLPREFCDRFMEEHSLTSAEILENVYKRPFPNRYLASFAPFLARNVHNPAVKELVGKSFESFLKRNVMQYDYSIYETSFIGSIAWHFSDILKETATDLGVRVGNIHKSPLEGLLKYHRDRVLN